MTTPIRLYLVRHGQAEPSHPLGDAARRLTPEGRAEFRARAAALPAGARIALVLASPFARARETAEILGATAGAAVEAEEALVAGRTPGHDLLDLARLRGDGTAVVGHNPEIADAITAAGAEPRAVPPGTIACVEVEADGSRPRLLWVR